MMKTFVAAIVFSTIALGGFAAFAADSDHSNNSGAIKQPDASATDTDHSNNSGAILKPAKSDDSVAKKCADILANKADHTAAELAACPK